LKVPLGPIVVNAVPSDALSGPEADAILGPLAAAANGGGPAPPDAPGDGTDGLGATLRLAASLRSHRRVADEQLERLRRDPGGPLILLPRLPSADLGPPDVAVLAARIAAAEPAPASVPGVSPAPTPGSPGPAPDGSPGPAPDGSPGPAPDGDVVRQSRPREP
jgi:hypothetical protein